jgi:hypothetical protein
MRWLEYYKLALSRARTQQEGRLHESTRKIKRVYKSKYDVRPRRAVDVLCSSPRHCSIIFT